MTSIQSAMTDLEKCDQLRQLTLNCYVSAVQSAAEYAVELEDAITAHHRKYMKTLADSLDGSTSEGLLESRTVFRGLLRDYREQSAQFLQQLRAELSNTAGSLQEIFNAFNQTDGDHESKLRRAVKSLREIATFDRLEMVQAALGETTGDIEQSLEDLRKQHQVTVAQFLVEIRGLHQRIDTLEAAAALDSMTKVFNRAGMEKRVREAQDGASLMLVAVQGIRQAEEQFSRAVAEELAGAFIKRLRHSLTPNAVLGRWGTEEFLAVGPRQNSEAKAAAKWIAERLSGAYACLQGGKTVRPEIQVAVSVVDRPPGGEAESALAQVRDHFQS